MVIFLIAFVLLLVIGVPISISIGASAVLGCLSLGYPLVVIGQKMVSGIDSFLLIAVPLFILAGNLMNAGKITEKIFDTAKELVGWIPGGLGHANVVASIIFAGMSGSAVADAGGLGAIEMEAMKKNGYDEDFAGAVTAASSVIGPIFPPSIPLIIYGSVASVSVDQLFMGGVVPGLLMGVLLMVMVLYFAIVRRYERHPFRLRALIRQFLGSIPALITPVIILCGFVVGWFTPTEASSIAVIYSLLIALFLYRTLDWKSFKKCLKDSAISSANTLFIIGTSTLFTYVMAMEGISRQFADVILGISSNPNVVLLVINGPGYGDGARRHPDPDAPCAAAHCQRPGAGPGPLRRYGGTQPDDRSGDPALRRVPVRHLRRKQAEAGTAVSIHPALPGPLDFNADSGNLYTGDRYGPAKRPAELRTSPVPNHPIVREEYITS